MPPGGIKQMSGIHAIRFLYAGPPVEGRFLQVRLPKKWGGHGRWCRVGRLWPDETLAEIPLYALTGKVAGLDAALAAKHLSFQVENRLGQPIRRTFRQRLDISKWIELPLLRGLGQLFFGGKNAAKNRAFSTENNKHKLLDKLFWVSSPEIVHLAASEADPTCVRRAKRIRRGLNCSNWLEAYWLQADFPSPEGYAQEEFELWKAWGLDTLRIPIWLEGLCAEDAPFALDFSHPVFVLLEKAIAWSEAHGFSLILVNQHGQTLTDQSYPAALPKTIALWKQLARHYRGLDAERFFFELRNEPGEDFSNTHVRRFFQTIAEALRSEDPDRTLVVGASRWNHAEALCTFAPLDDPNILYTFHSYDPYDFTHQQLPWAGNLPVRVFPFDEAEETQIIDWFWRVKHWSTDHNVPVFLGELGLGKNTDPESRARWVNCFSNLLEETEIPWLYWDYKGDFALEKGEHSALFPIP